MVSIFCMGLATMRKTLSVADYGNIRLSFPAEASDLAQASFLAPGNGTSTVTSSGVWIDPPVSSYARAPTARSIKKNTEISKYAFAFPPLWDRKVAQSYGISLDSTGQNYDRIRGIGGAVMPPPPPGGEGPWPQARIELFARWMADGYQP
jgi:hypothetical protein